MSTTNVPADQPQADDHDGFGKPSAEALRLKYEPDGYDKTSVVSVPVLVVFFFVIAFAATTLIYGYFTRPVIDQLANPMLVERNSEPLNDRMKRIDRRAGDIKQPRLEAFRTRSGDNRAITRPEIGDDNPPYVTPEDSRVEPARTPELFRTSWGDGEKTFARIPLDRVLLAADNKLFPVSEKFSSLPRKSFQFPSGANAGRGAEDSTVVMPIAPAQAAPKKKDEIPPPKKPEEPKKVDGKKDQPQPPPKPEDKK